MKSLYKVFNKIDNPNLTKFHNFILNYLTKHYDVPNNDLSLIHKVIDSKNLNPIRLKLFNLLNSKLNWEQLIFDMCKTEIFSIIGPDILIQSKINLSIQMPKDQNSILSFHSDCGSGDTPFQINLWIPLTNTFETNSMFVIKDKDNMKLINNKIKFKNYKLKKEDFIKLYYGQILFFNPAIYHGNTKNLTNRTRISLNIRMKAVFSPDAKNDNPDRKIGTYYKILNLSENTRFSLNFAKSKYYE